MAIAIFDIILCQTNKIYLRYLQQYKTTIKQRNILLQTNPTTEMIMVPRVNTVKGLTQEHINKWRWNVNKEGWVNYPDYQGRIYKNNGKIKWRKPVHEVLSGHETFSHLPPREEFSFYHHKKITKQEQQNKLYSEITSGKN